MNKVIVLTLILVIGGAMMADFFSFTGWGSVMNGRLLKFSGIPFVGTTNNRLSVSNTVKVNSQHALNADIGFPTSIYTVPFVAYEKKIYYSEEDNDGLYFFSNSENGTALTAAGGNAFYLYSGSKLRFLDIPNDFLENSSSSPATMHEVTENTDTSGMTETESTSIGDAVYTDLPPYETSEGLNSQGFFFGKISNNQEFTIPLGNDILKMSGRYFDAAGFNVAEEFFADQIPNDGETLNTSFYPILQENQIGYLWYPICGDVVSGETSFGGGISELYIGGYVKPNSISIEIIYSGGGVLTGSDDGNGTIPGIGTVDYLSGEVHLSVSTTDEDGIVTNFQCLDGIDFKAVYFSETSNALIDPDNGNNLGSINFDTGAISLTATNAPSWFKPGLIVVYRLDWHFYINTYQMTDHDVSRLFAYYGTALDLEFTINQNGFIDKNDKFFLMYMDADASEFVIVSSSGRNTKILSEESHIVFAIDNYIFIMNWDGGTNTYVFNTTSKTWSTLTYSDALYCSYINKYGDYYYLYDYDGAIAIKDDLSEYWTVSDTTMSDNDVDEVLGGADGYFYCRDTNGDYLKIGQSDVKRIGKSTNDDIICIFGRTEYKFIF